jgi:hypothetical protein
MATKKPAWVIDVTYDDSTHGIFFKPGPTQAKKFAIDTALSSINIERITVTDQFGFTHWNREAI